MRLRHKVNVQIADDADFTDKLFYPDDVASQVSTDAFQRFCSSKMKVEANTTESVSFGDVDLVKGVYLKFDQDVQVKINGGAAMQLRRNSAATGTVCKYFMEGDITSVQVIAPTLLDANGVVVVWGDPSA